MVQRSSLFTAAALTLLLSLSLTACQSEPESSTVVSSLTPSPDALRMVTWNVEHLAWPRDTGCRPRTEEEWTALQAYARGLDADIVALQEVASLEAVAALFPPDQWQLFISERADSEPYECRDNGHPSTQQKVAFAVANDIEVLGKDGMPALGLDLPGLRHGLALSLATSMGPLRLLNVHMKSGCFVDNYAREESEACQTFSRQAPILDAWIEDMERTGQPFMVLGDFNHRLSAPYNELTRLITQRSDGSPSTVVNATAQLIGCHPWYPAAIDHILMGNMQDPALVTTAQVHPFETMDPEVMLSDHCAVSLTMEVGQLPLSSSVTWQTTSKEYAFLTTSAYQRAAAQLSEMALPETPWVVSMDIDETVLDNSQYQVMLDRTGRSFTSESWAEWVQGQEATLVPGVAPFMDTVVELGGRFAFITNRERDQDVHTWQNMEKMGLPVTLENACLMGRSSGDVSSVDGITRINDKDLRRQQVEDGTASCFRPGGGRHSSFPAAAILMQVGDNIEDFVRTTQEDADVDALLAEEGSPYILLPNPMYGSW